MIRWLICKLFHRGVWRDTEHEGFNNRSMWIAFACKECGRTWEVNYGA